MIRNSLFLVIAFLLIATVPYSIAANEIKSISQVQNATFVDLDGNNQDIVQFKGKVLLLNFWASWCAPCIIEVPSLNRMHEKYSPRGLELLSLSLDTQFGLTRIKDIAKQHRMRYAVGKAETAMINELKIYAIPMSYLVGKDGKIIRRYMGPPNPSQLQQDIEKALGN